MQVIGSVMGCVIAPLTFLMFYKAFPVGVPGTAYPAPYATIYRAMAILGVEVGTFPYIPMPYSPATLLLVLWPGHHDLGCYKVLEKHRSSMP